MGTVISVGDKQPKDAKRLAGFLITYDHNPVGEYFPVYEGRNIVGRDASANICIRGDEQVSEKHFALVYRTAEKKFKFKDELSSNGTFVNDTLADEGELTNFDVIRIGATRLLFIAIPDF
jgi:pSer/pThr/pTyr-binding forkhead associated (FHA) protein